MADGRTAGAVAPNPEYRGTIVRAIEASPFLVENGIRFVDCGPGWCEASVAMTPRHLQHTGVPHAGIVAKRLVCRAQIVEPGRRVSFVESSIEAELENGERRLVARATVTLSVLPRERVRFLPTSPETT